MRNLCLSMNKLVLLLKGQIALWSSSKDTNPNIWVFSSKDNKAFNYNSKYLFLYVLEHLKQIKPLYVINDDHERAALQKEYGEEYFIETESFAGMKKALEAGVWFTSAGMPVYALNSGKNRKIVNLWHGVPLKKIALMEQNVPWWEHWYFKRMFSKNYDCILTTSDALIPVMAESFAVSEDKIKVWGQPRNDVLVDVSQQKKKLSDFIDVPEYDKAILYAPTFRDNGITQWFPFEDFDKEKLQKFLEDNRILLCLRAHVNENVSEEYCYCPNIINLSSEVIDDITGYLYMFDLLITDYSSIYIDYMLLNRPMLFLPYDKEQYLKDRGMNFEYDKVTPGKKPVTNEEFMQAIISELQQDSMKEERQKMNDIFNQIQTPCSKRICEEILGGQ